MIIGNTPKQEFVATWKLSEKPIKDQCIDYIIELLEKIRGFEQDLIKMSLTEDFDELQEELDHVRQQLYIINNQADE